MWVSNPFVLMHAQNRDRRGTNPTQVLQQLVLGLKEDLRCQLRTAIDAKEELLLMAAAAGGGGAAANSSDPLQLRAAIARLRPQLQLRAMRLGALLPRFPRSGDQAPPPLTAAAAPQPTPQDGAKPHPHRPLPWLTISVQPPGSLLDKPEPLHVDVSSSEATTADASPGGLETTTGSVPHPLPAALAAGARLGGGAHPPPSAAAAGEGYPPRQHDQQQQHHHHHHHHQQQQQQQSDDDQGEDMDISEEARDEAAPPPPPPLPADYSPPHLPPAAAVAADLGSPAASKGAATAAAAAAAAPEGAEAEAAAASPLPCALPGPPATDGWSKEDCVCPCCFIGFQLPEQWWLHTL